MPGTDARLRVASIVIALLLAAPAAAHAAAGDVVLVSRAATANGVSGNGSSSRPAASPDGHLIAFQSAAKNLVSDSPQAGTTEAYVRDVDANTIELVSRADGAGGTPSSANVSDVGLSDDGRYVVYATGTGVYLRDRTQNTTTLVAAGGVRPAISGDGGTIAYGAQSSGSLKVFAYDVATQNATVVSVGLNGLPMTGDNPVLSRDGRIVAFSGQGGTSQIWVRDRNASTTALASRASGTDGQQASSAAIEPAISANGRYVVFRSAAPNLSDDDADNTDDIFERDLAANTTALVSRADGPTGAAADNDCDLPSVSGDGTRVFFRSRATNLSAEDNSSGDNGFVRDTASGTTTWVHGAAHQSPAPQGVMDGLALSGDGRYAVFAGNATLLPGQETGSFGDIFRRDLGATIVAPPLPSASISADQAVTEGDTAVTFTVTLSAADPRPIAIGWHTVDGTATAGSDYRAASGQVTFAPGQTQAFLSVNVLEDTTHEGDEAFSVALTDPVNVTLGRATATVTVHDDDPLFVPPPFGPPSPPPGPPAFPANTGTPATTCATQTTQGLAVLRGCIANGRMTGVVSLNGLTVDLGGNALVVEASRIESTGPVTISAGDVVINRGTNLVLDPKSGLATLTAPSGTSLYGLSLQPKLALKLAAGGVANLAGYVTLPLGGDPLSLSFQASDADGLRRGSLKASASAASFKHFLSDTLAFTFDPASQTWRGGLTIRTFLPGFPSLKLAGSIARSGAITLGGTLPSGKASGGFTLHTASITFVPNPEGIEGRLAFDAGPFNLLSFDGGLKYTFGAAPSFSGTVKIFGLPLGAPSIGGVMGMAGGLGGGGLPAMVGAVANQVGQGGFTFGGTQPLAFGSAPGGHAPAGPAASMWGGFLGGAIGGWLPKLDFGMNPLTGSLFGGGAGQFNILGATISGDATANRNGFAVCGDLGFLHFGVGVRWNPFNITPMGPATCDVGPWRASASAAQAGKLTLPAGVQVLRLHGTAPATLHGPGGQTVSTATAPQVGATAIVLKDQTYTYVALKNPKGSWTVDGISGVDSAAQLTPAKVTAKVVKHGVRWTQRVSPGQVVTLAEQGTGVYHELGRLHGKRGTLRFTPAPGGGRRSIVAVVTEGGLPASHSVVAHFTAPKPRKPGRPGKVTVKLTGKRMAISWKAAAHARGYIVSVRTPNGTLVALPAKPRTTLTDILPVTKATVTVTAISAEGLRGPARKVTARRHR